MCSLMVATAPTPTPGWERSWEVCNGWASFTVQCEHLGLSQLASGIQWARKKNTTTTKRCVFPPSLPQMYSLKL